MMNIENGLLSRSSGEVVKSRMDAFPGMIAATGNFNDAAMMQRNDTMIPVQTAQAQFEPEEKEILGPEPIVQPAAAPVPVPASNRAASTQNQQVQPAKQATQAPAEKPQKAAAVSAPTQTAMSAKIPGPITGVLSPDKLCQTYATMFRSSLGLELSMAICFENMRRMCEIDTRDPKGTLYFLENTYRVSTLIYLASNLPILFVTSVLAEKNRKNILKYVTIEVENGSKPFQELLDLRKRRWARKFESMAVNDAMTVTPGATMLTPELSGQLSSELTAISAKLRRFNQEMTDIVSKFDDAARNDIIYIYSNWWYLLQGFENVPEMRSYIMAVTDDTRKNLKI